MSEEPRDDDNRLDGSDPDREAILSRRSRFLAAALTGLALSGCASSVGDADSATPDAADARVGSDSQPMPCLSRPLDDVVAADAAPSPCLDIAPGDAGGDF